MRFDCSARAEIFIDQDDIEFHKDFDAVKASSASEEEKIAQLKRIALQVANEKISEVRGEVQLEVDISDSDINIDRIDWVDLLHDDEEDEYVDMPSSY